MAGAFGENRRREIVRAGVSRKEAKHRRSVLLMVHATAKGGSGDEAARCDGRCETSGYLRLELNAN